MCLDYKGSWKEKDDEKSKKKIFAQYESLGDILYSLMYLCTRKKLL